MEARTVTAIEIASSKIKGAVASVDTTGRMTVLAVAEMRTDNSVRHGRVQNVRGVSAAVNEIVRRLEAAPEVAPRQIRTVTLSLGGRSLGGTPTSASIQFQKDLEITEQAIRRLRNEAEKDFSAAKTVEATIARKYYVNNAEVDTPVGTVGSSLKGDFLMVTCAPENRHNLERLKFDRVASADVDYRIRALATADAVLTPDDRQLGCALLDFGAETTTVSVYKNGSLAFISTLPMGSRLITKDLMAGLTLTEAAAEDFKITLGNLTDDTSENPNAEEVNNYVRARAGEIAANMVNQIELSGVKLANLGAGLVLIGGGSKLPGFDSFLAAQTHLAVRKGALPAGVSFLDPAKATFDNIDIVSLLLAADPDMIGLTSPVVPEAVVPEVADDEPVITIDESNPEAAPEVIQVLDEADDEPEEQPVHPVHPEPEKTPRHRPAERLNDRYVLDDDPDEDDEQLPPSTANDKFDDEDEDEEFEEPKAAKPSRDRAEGHKPGRFSGMLKSLSDSMARIFLPDDSENDNSDDEDYDSPNTNKRN